MTHYDLLWLSVLLVGLGLLVCLAMFVFMRISAEAYERGVHAGYRKSTKAVPKEVTEETDEVYASMAKQMRAAMNGEMEEFDQVPTDDLGYPEEEPVMMTRDNFRAPDRVRRKGGDA